MAGLALSPIVRRIKRELGMSREGQLVVDLGRRAAAAGLTDRVEQEIRAAGLLPSARVVERLVGVCEVRADRGRKRG